MARYDPIDPAGVTIESLPEARHGRHSTGGVVGNASDVGQARGTTDAGDETVELK